MIWVGSAPDAVTNPGFETDVTSGWTLSTVIGSTVARDTTAPAAGAASAHITVPVAGSNSWSTVFETNGTIGVAAGQTYSGTFWARSDRARTIFVETRGAAGAALAFLVLPIGTTWKQYQVALVPPVSGNWHLGFFLGDQAGDVWLDDCHFQAGITSVYRRDFQNGVVLVNPASTPLTLPLERTYRKIAGITDPTVNNGQSVTQVTIGASDALFLIGTDVTPPGNILDLHRVP
jgi:hypothetical protein